MIDKIKNLNDVAAFAEYLISQGTAFHPDDDFSDYINTETEEFSFTREEAHRLNVLMSECFEICEAEGVDIYDYMLEIVLKSTGMSSFIPLPSENNN